ncbi:phage holin family protein [Noviherbaspirillum aridicola]|uniref:phage holin family protein n=1 Tax=Noviherbaspirillum aridicola TaxID=2849687 RepID=UPI001C82772A|nr:phage holin family protein [Noviherbaspirillum aridicola]
MNLADSATRLGASLLAILQTRVELVAAEVEEESLRYFSYLMMSLAALFCLGVAVVLCAMLLLVLFWDSYRIPVLLFLILLFGGAAAWLGLKLRQAYRLKPPLLAHTMMELARDRDTLRPQP